MLRIIVDHKKEQVNVPLKNAAFLLDRVVTTVNDFSCFRFFWTLVEMSLEIRSDAVIKFRLFFLSMLIDANNLSLSWRRSWLCIKQLK